MGHRPHSSALSWTATAVAAPEPKSASPAARRGSAPYAERSKGYIRTLAATSIGLELAVSVVLPLLLGIWLDRRYQTSPWLMLLCLGIGFAAGIRAVWRHVAAADGQASESEEPPATGPGPTGTTP